jgi:glycolate oxidase iron-sulfur subunit
MQLQIQRRALQPLLSNPQIDEAESILRSCVHCGFCLATCPTYQLLGSELDSPRGRVYQIKQLLEGQHATAATQQHLDRCLTCRNCESTCPSGIRFGNLLAIGRSVVEQQVRRPWRQWLTIQLLRHLIPYRRRITPLLHLGQLLRIPLARQAASVGPATATSTDAPRPAVSNRIILFQGCVQNGLAPVTNQALRQLLQRLGFTIEQPRKEGCCGALSHHLSASQQSLRLIRNNINQWLPLVESGARIVVAASGCGAMVSEYGELLQEDPEYAEAAARISRAVVDPANLLLPYLNQLRLREGVPRRIAYHPPCSQQHKLRSDQAVEQLLAAIGVERLAVADRHLCCGAAGSYAILQRGIADQLRRNKLEALQQPEPELIATANIGCQHHLQQATATPVIHWVELVTTHHG